MTDYTLTITNKKIWTFYNENPNLSFENMNLILHDFVEKLFDDKCNVFNNSISSQILNSITHQSYQLNDFKTQLNSISNSMSNLNNDITNNIIVKFMDIKKDYIDDVKSIIANNSNDKSDKIISLIEKNNNILIDKTTLVMNDVIPKTQEKYYGQIEKVLRTFHNTISEDTNSLLKSVNNDSLKDFISNFEVKCAGMLQNVQQPIYTYIASSEERIQNNLISMKDSTSSTLTKQDTIMNELSDYLKKFRNSSYKGTFGENHLESLLTLMFPCGEILNTSGQRASGDFILRRENKPTIMFENKAYDRNVNPDEVKKFIRDSEELNCHAIFLSQHTGITCKPNYHIDINKGNILVYIHNTEYSKEKIQLAIDIIENLDPKLEELSYDIDESSVSKDVLDDINREFQNFITQKDALVNISKDIQKKLLLQIDELRFPALEKFLSTKYATTKKSGYSCHLCNNFDAPTKKSLSAHIRGCSKKNNFVQPTSIFINTQQK